MYAFSFCVVVFVSCLPRTSGCCVEFIDLITGGGGEQTELRETQVEGGINW